MTLKIKGVMTGKEFDKRFPSKEKVFDIKARWLLKEVKLLKHKLDSLEIDIGMGLIEPLEPTTEKEYKYYKDKFKEINGYMINIDNALQQNPGKIKLKEKSKTKEW